MLVVVIPSIGALQEHVSGNAGSKLGSKKLVPYSHNFVSAIAFMLHA